MTGYKFQSLRLANQFKNICNKPHFIFHAPITGYVVVDSRTAKKLWADGHADIVWSATLQTFVTIPQ